MTEVQKLLIEHLVELGFAPVTEYRFHPERKWRFDVAFLSDTNNIGIEIEGGAWSQGRHVRGAGYIKDLEKYNMATAMGWKVYRFTPQQVMDGTAREFIEKWL